MSYSGVMTVKGYIEKQLALAVEKIGFNPTEIFIDIEKTRLSGMGDFTTNIAMKNSKIFKSKPLDIARQILENIDFDSTIVEKSEIANPGFLNFFVSKNYFFGVIKEIYAQSCDSLFRNNIYYKDKKVIVEFVSANPTGPLNVVSARAAAIGDCVAKLLDRGGAAKITKEFYINDAGRQVNLLGESVKARYIELITGECNYFPEDGYHGVYIRDIAQAFRKKHGDGFVDETTETFIEFSLDYNISWQKKTLANYGVEFDVWYSEKKLRGSGKVEKVLEGLKKSGKTYESEGAMWFKATEYGDEKDRVLVTQEGLPTYFLPDIAYHNDKIERGHDVSIGYWGPDHHGYFARLHGALESLGYSKEMFDLRIVQQVNLKRDGENVKMSKRTGEIVMMDELIEEVGKDAAKYFFLERTASSHLDFDIEIAKKQGDENPVFYIQYAHARICSILNSDANSFNFDNVDTTLLSHPSEILLIKKCYEYQDIIEIAIKYLEPHRINHYLCELAGEFHNFYQQCRVITEPQELKNARGLLICCVKKIIADGLSILGISAPEKM